MVIAGAPNSLASVLVGDDGQVDVDGEIKIADRAGTVANLTVSGRVDADTVRTGINQGSDAELQVEDDGLFVVDGDFSVAEAGTVRVFIEPDGEVATGAVDVTKAATGRGTIDISGIWTAPQMNIGINGPGTVRLLQNGRLNAAASVKSFGKLMAQNEITGNVMMIAGAEMSIGDLEHFGDVAELTIGGNFDSSAGGDLYIDINGADAGIGHDLISVAGNAIFGGDLNVSFNDAPAVGNTYEILTAASGTGEFNGIPPGIQNPASTSLPSLPTGMYWDVSYDTGVTLSIGSLAEIEVFDSADEVIDDSGWVDFGTASVGTPVNVTLDINNTGGADLTVDWSTLTLPPGFSSTATGTEIVSPGGTTTFTITMDAAAAGWYGGDVSFDNNDSDENPFNFYVDGYVNAPPEVFVADDDFGGSDFKFEHYEWETAAEITIELANPDGNSHTVEFYTEQITATEDADYVGVPVSAVGSVTFGPWETMQTVSVDLIDDAIDESDEEFRVRLQAGAGAGYSIFDDEAIVLIYGETEGGGGSGGGGTGSPEVAISDDDGAGGDYFFEVYEWESSAWIEVVLHHSDGSTVTVDYATAETGTGDSATSGSDFTPTSGTLTFDEYTTMAYIEVPLLDDSESEADEYFYLNLSNASGATITDSQAVVMIYGEPEYLTLGLPARTTPADPRLITVNDVRPLLSAAARQWVDAGVSPADAMARLHDVDVSVADLPGSRLAYVAGDRLVVDVNAAGYGWFVDATPLDAGEFDNVVSSNQRLATIASDAAGRVDLLTALTHEFGHLLGREDIPATLVPDRIMSSLIGLGTRRTVLAEDVSSSISQPPNVSAHAAHFAAVDFLFGVGAKTRSLIAKQFKIGTDELDHEIDGLLELLDDDGRLEWNPMKNN